MQLRCVISGIFFTSHFSILEVNGDVRLCILPDDLQTYSLLLTILKDKRRDIFGLFRTKAPCLLNGPDSCHYFS